MEQVVVWVCGEESDRRRVGEERLGRSDRFRSFVAEGAGLRMTTDIFCAGGELGAATQDGGVKPPLHMELGWRTDLRQRLDPRCQQGWRRYKRRAAPSGSEGAAWRCD
jgi:hypothetical protein